MSIKGSCFTIRPVVQDEIEAILNVYQQCEDFLALGPEAAASMGMALNDIAMSKAEGGVFCGVYDRAGKMIGVVDVVLNGFEGNSQQAFISLLMIAASHRRQGIGTEIVELLEKEIKKTPQVRAILSGVQTNNPEVVRFWQKNGYQICQVK